jgi:predicted SPOUT superfamily RNA methylase MTH1
MMEVPRRPQRLSVALPASFTKDVPHLREKTSRAGLIARSLAIFRVDEVVIYDDETGRNSESEGKLFEKLLVYQETPQYLRKALFKQDLDLQFSGILPPLRMPSHPSMAEPRIGDIREGLVIESGASSMVNAGFRVAVQVLSKLRPLERVTIRLVRISPQLQGEPVEPTRLPIYWGFRVTRTNLTLGRLIRSRSQDLTISTSRRGKVVRDVLNDLTVRWKSSQRPMVVFGSPSKGVPEILAKEGTDLGRMVDFNLNMIANQGVETVRTEEAVLATMSILNLLEET